jgi:DNA-binding transcriptional regulator GbsR (MarR family)
VTGRDDDDEHDPLHAAQDEIAEVFGNIAAFWGFTRTQGRIFGLLFLSPEPLGHAEIHKRLDASAGSVSMTLSSLVHWGVLHRQGRLYVAETDFWKLVTGVMRRREREQVDDAIERVELVSRSLAKAAKTDPRLRFARARVDHVLDFFKLGRRFLDAFVARTPLHGLLSTIAQRAARIRSLRSGRDDDRVGA